MTVPTTEQEGRSGERAYGMKPPLSPVKEVVKYIRAAAQVVGERGPLSGLAEVMNYSPGSSNFRLKIANMRKMDVIKIDGQNYSFADTGRRISRPQSPDDERTAIQSAFLSIPTLKSLWEHYEGQTLPQKEYVANFMVTSLNVPTEHTDGWYDYFLDSGLYTLLVQPSASGGYRVVSRKSGAQKPAMDVAEEKDTAFNPTVVSTPRQEPPRVENAPEGIIGGMNLSTPVSGNRTATFVIPNRLQQADIESIRALLKGIDIMLDGFKVNE